MGYVSGLLYIVGDYIVFAINACAIIIIVIGMIKTLLMYLRAEWELIRTDKSFNDFHHIRQELASYLLLSLEFVIAADIIHTISDPTLENLLLLGLIVLIRTAISFVLERELTLKHKKPK